MDVAHNPVVSPFNHIALSLSGGGVRAVGYHLGTLDYLERIGLLKEVHTLSSVSGGSLIAIGYALSLKKGESFQDFYDNLCEFLPQINTLEELLKVLNRPLPPVASGSRTLITALAAVYREKYFEKYYGDPAFGVFWEHEPDIHIKELIFNATEFKTGIGFRFQRGQYRSLTGNTIIKIKEEYAKDIRMSDIMAASSCIPGGMEPMMFPQDFHWPDDPTGTALKNGRGKRPRCDEVIADMEERFGISNVPLMDGGVYDNQGITSIIATERDRFRSRHAAGPIAEEELASPEPQRPRSWARWLLQSMESASDIAHQKDMGEIDLFIVSDTPIQSDPMYSIPARDWGTGLVAWIRQLKLGWIHVAGWAVTSMLLIGVIVGIALAAIDTGLFVNSANSLMNAFRAVDLETTPVWMERLVLTIYFGGLIVLIGVVILAIVLLISLHKFTSRSVRRIVEVIPDMSSSVWSYTKSLRLGQIWDMATLRASSMSALTAKIFMNRVRQLGYSLLYSHTQFERRVMDNNINDTLYAETNTDVPEFVRDPSDAAEKVMKRAATMPTKLWVNKPEAGEVYDDLHVLIAAGHISTCFNIIEHLWEYHRDENGILDPRMLPLFESAKSDWQLLNQNPYMLVEQRDKHGRKRGELFWSKITSRFGKKPHKKPDSPVHTG